MYVIAQRIMMNLEFFAPLGHFLERERRDREERERQERERQREEEEQREQKYYEILSINHDASKKDIRRARKKLVQHWHPDELSIRLGREPNIDELKELAQKIKEINKAYEFLTDSTRYYENIPF